MTASVQNRIDEWIARVRARAEMADIRFLPAYPPHKTPDPITKYTVAVISGEGKVKRYFVGGRIGTDRRGKLVESELRLRVYAPERTSGAALLRVSALLTDALEAEDRERAITELSLSGIGFDTSARTEYRDVIANVLMKAEEEIGWMS